MQRYAIVDLGSNTIRLSVYEQGLSGKLSLIFSEKETAGLAGYVKEERMAPAGIDRACRALVRLQRLAEMVDAGAPDVFATASLRNVRNREEAVKKIADQTGIEVDVLSGPREAALSCRGAFSEADLPAGVLFDIGGGSTELAVFQEDEIISAQSMEIGSLTLFRKFVGDIMPDRSEIAQMRSVIERRMDALRLPALPEGGHLCAVGGTARALLKIAREWSILTRADRTLTFSELERTSLKILERGREARDVILRCCPDRCHTIIPGTLLMYLLCMRMDCKDVYISASGVREGYLRWKLSEEGQS